MQSETRTCQNCHQSFTIESEDFAFYEKIKVPPPTFCPECRLIRRLTYRNERTLYKRPCDLCGQERVFFFPKSVKFPVYCRECWWSDKWNPLSSGFDYDFSKTFFGQFQELLQKVPRPGTIKQGNSIDSEYTNRVTDMKNCYLIFGTTIAEDCRYGVWLNESKNCMDCYNTQKSERCYECVDVLKGYNLSYGQECIECGDSSFLYNCRNCTNCFGCVNLRNKSYYLFNKPYKKEEYQKAVAQFNSGSSLTIDGIKKRLDVLRNRHVVPSLVTHHSVNVSGNWIENSKNIFRSFNCLEIEDGRYCYNLIYGKDVMDFGPWSNHSERIYEAINVGIQCANVKFSHECWSQLLDSEYCMNCHSSQDLFGCIGLRNKQYCILNKQYTKDEYSNLVPRIKKQMAEMPYYDKKGRVYKYGEFFPIELAPHPYNETLAQEFFPVTKAEAEAGGYPWRDPETKDYSATLSVEELPDSITAVEDSITKEVISCAHDGKCNQQCTKAFRIIAEELIFYRRMNLPLPRLCPNCRHYERLKQRNPLKLWHRQCQCAGQKSGNDDYQNTTAHFHGAGKCPNEFETSYAPDRKEIVYCEQCYNAEVV